VELTLNFRFVHSLAVLSRLRLENCWGRRSFARAEDGLNTPIR